MDKLLFLPGKTDVKDLLKKFKLNEDTISGVLGVLAVLLVVYLLWGYFKSVNQGQISNSSANTEATQSTQPKPLGEIKTTDLPTNYILKPGDSLWKIAQTVYGSGYEWSKVYTENKDKISNPNLVYAGVQITLPKIEAAAAATPQTYTVVAGDNLWNIGVKLCGSGFVWTQIAADNSLANPRLIHPGNVLKVRCGKI